MDKSEILNSFTTIAKKLQHNQELVENHRRRQPTDKRTLIAQMNMILFMFSEFAQAQGSFLYVLERLFYGTQNLCIHFLFNSLTFLSRNFFY